MANVISILSEIKTLSQYQQEQLLSHLEEYLVLGAQVGQVTKEVKKRGISSEQVCVATALDR